MTIKFVTITMEVPVTAIDFSDCGDGCGQIDGLKYAKFKGAAIERFATEDLLAAEESMREALGEPAGRAMDSKHEWRARMTEITVKENKRSRHG